MTSRQHDPTTLPRWAQAQLRRLEADVEFWRTRATAGEDGPTDTSVRVAFNAEPRWLENGARVRFQLDPEAPYGGYVEAQIDDGALVVRTQGDRRPATVPVVANVLKVVLV